MKRLLSATLLAALALGSLAGCGGEPGRGEPGDQPSASAGSSLAASPSSSPSISGSPTASGSPLSPASPSGTTTSVAIESVDGDWLTDNAENAVALIRNGDNVEGVEIVLGGSGTKPCAPTIKEAKVEGDTLVITLAALKADQICTADLRPYNFRLLFPEAEKIDTVRISHDPDFDHFETFTKEEFVSIPE